MTDIARMEQDKLQLSKDLFLFPSLVYLYPSILPDSLMVTHIYGCFIAENIWIMCDLSIDLKEFQDSG